MTDVARPLVVVRPQPTDWERSRMAKGKKASPGASASWYEKGALSGADGAMWLTDADGNRRDLPLPPVDGGLLRIELPVQNGGSIGLFVSLFITDNSYKRLVELPNDGFDDTDALSRVSFAAGIKFGAYRTHEDYPFTKQTLDLRKSCLADADRHHLPHLLGGKG